MPCLDVALTPFLGEPCQKGFKWSASEVMVDECGVDAEGLIRTGLRSHSREWPTRMEVGAPWGAIMERSCVWTSVSVVVAVVGYASVTPDQLDGG